MDEAPDQSQTDGVDGSQDQDQQPDQAQEQPTQDSGLQTPQPDQPVPAEAERQTDDSQPPAEAAIQQDESAGEPETREAPRGAQRPTERDQLAEEEQRQSDLADQRQEHNERTGDGS